MHAATGNFQARLQLAQWLLTCADDDVIDGQDLCLAVDGDVQTGIVNAVVLHTRNHLYVACFERGAVYPAGGFTQAIADFARFALQQMDAALWRWCGRRTQTAGCCVIGIHAPFGVEGFELIHMCAVVVCDVLAHVKADAARADDGDVFTHRFFVAQHVQIVHDFGMVHAVNRRCTRHNASGQYDFVVAALHQHIDGGAGVELYVYAAQFELKCEIAQGFVEFILARYFFGDIELPADFARRFDQRDVMAALGCGGGECQTGRPCANDRHFFRCGRGFDLQNGFVAGAWIDQARGDFAGEGVIQTGLVTANTGINFIRATFACFDHELRIGEERTRHRDHVARAFGEQLLGDFGGVDAVGGDQRNTDFAH